MGSISGGALIREGGSMKIRMWVFSVTVLVAAGLLWSGAPVQAADEPGSIVFKDAKSFAPVFKKL